MSDSSFRPKLTAKQRKFIEAYAGNATEAARIAGYKGNAVTLASVAAENLRKPQISAAIKEREEKQIKSLIATRVDRQQFWTETMKDAQVDVRWQLKASELLGRSEADFTEKVEHSFAEGLAERMAKARNRRNG